jgi:2-methylcitrate dehydratase
MQTQSEQLAGYALCASYESLSAEEVKNLKAHVLDSLGCAIGAIEGDPIQAVRSEQKDHGGAGPCTIIGGGRTSPERAAFFNTALVRYLDFMDNYMSPGETCHPSDNFGAMLAAAEYANRSGRDFLTALAIAYHVQCRLTTVAPIMDHGFDHTTQQAYSVAAGVSRLLGLNAEQTTNALGICGAGALALAVTRTGQLSQWKGLASANVALTCLHSTFLAAHGVTGPREIFEGKMGFGEALETEFRVDWAREGINAIMATSLKRYNAEVHSQATLEGVLELREEHQLHADQIEKVEIDTFKVAYQIIGGGEWGDRHRVATKEQADHSLPYLAAVALIDGEVLPPQFVPERIERADVQDLLRRVTVRPSLLCSAGYPALMSCRIRIALKDGRHVEKTKQDYEGFFARPMPWEKVVSKFEYLAEPYAEADLRRRIVDVVWNLDVLNIGDLTALLAGQGG